MAGSNEDRSLPCLTTKYDNPQLMLSSNEYQHVCAVNGTGWTKRGRKTIVKTAPRGMIAIAGKALIAVPR